MVGDAYKDPNVTMTHVYGTCNGGVVRQVLSLNILDQYVLLMYVGFLGNLFDTLLKVRPFLECGSLGLGMSIAL